MTYQLNNSQNGFNKGNSYATEPIKNKTNPNNLTNVLDNKISKLEALVNANDSYLASLPPLEYENRYMPNITKTNSLDNGKTNLKNNDNEDVNSVLAYAQKANTSAATKHYSNLYNTYGLNNSI